MAKKALYKTAKGYYEGAYRAQMKTLRGHWTTGQMTATAGWMWNHVATQAEINACTALFKAKSTENTFEADASKIPDGPKKASDGAPEVAAATPDEPAEGAAGAGETERPAAGDARSGADATGAAGAARATQPSGDEPARAPVEPTAQQAQPSRGNTKVNTTVFNYMPPNLREAHWNLPHLDEDELTAAQKRVILEAALGDREEEDRRWRGADFLGAGATGDCTLWVQVDYKNNIKERLAVKDVGTIHQARWIDPTNWRGRLPREIAIMKRLHDQGGASRNIHRYFGHRIDMYVYKRRYRIYTEVCDLGNIKGALKHYSRLWRRRRNKYKWNNWVKRHAKVQQAKAKNSHLPADSVEMDVLDTKREIMMEVKKASEEEKNKPQGGPKPEKDPRTEFGDMSDIEDWFDEEVEEDLPGVIPEAFLWHVFDQLVDAALVMKDGGNPLVPLENGEKWKEIVHKDLHPGNIFVKPHEQGFLGNGSYTDPRKPQKSSFAAFKKSEYPNVILADFDTAIFDLQDGDDEYQDNPIHYMLGDKPKDAAGGRYPPEAFFSGQNMNKLTKFTSASDVWGIGAIMWNLVMNIPHSHEYIAPFYDNAAQHYAGGTFERLNHGIHYSNAVLNDLMTGDTPFEAAGQYSDVLKYTIKGCLPFEQRHRTKLKSLKQTTAHNLKIHMEKDGAADLIVRTKGGMQGFQVGERFKYVHPTDGEGEDWKVLWR